MVACHYPTNTLPQYYGAMNQQDYDDAAVCGACVEITNTQNNSTLQVEIVDLCPIQGNEEWCFNGSHHIDLNPAAYNALGADNNPAISWRYVPCDHSGNISWHVDSGSNPYYQAITPMDHENLIDSVEIRDGNGQYRQMTHTDYNVWYLDAGVAITSPYTVRVTDIYGNQLVDTVTGSPGQVVNGGQQLPVCE
jgi:expansin (peptidoglycan-binding protein)